MCVAANETTREIDKLWNFVGISYEIDKVFNKYFMLLNL